MINGEFKHSIGLLCNLAVLLIFSLGMFASHQRNVYLSFPTASSQMVGSVCVSVCEINYVVTSDIYLFQSHIILKFGWIRSVQFWCVVFVYKHSVFFPCSYAFESVGSFQQYKGKLPKCVVI